MPGYILRCLSAPFMSVGMPLMDKLGGNSEILEGAGISRGVGKYCREHGYRRALIVTDENVRALGLTREAEDGLRENEVSFTIFDHVLPDPTHDMVWNARTCGVNFASDCVIAIGGGSVMDCAKIASIGIKNPGMARRRLMRLQLGKKPGTVPLIAVPTTAGTGAEVTVGAVITDDRTHTKHCAGGPKVKPRLCILDSGLTAKCPPRLTASTGIDALSHGIEAYLGRVRLPEEKKKRVVTCVKLAMEYLPAVLDDPGDLNARLEMSRAAMLGGEAINMCTAGYCHSFAHTIGAVYNIPHGEAIAITLLPAMRYQRDADPKKLAQLARECGMGKAGAGDAELADRFIADVGRLIESTGLSGRLIIDRKDFPALIKRAFRDSLLMIPTSVMRYSDGVKMLEMCSMNKSCESCAQKTELV